MSGSRRRDYANPRDVGEPVPRTEDDDAWSAPPPTPTPTFLRVLYLALALVPAAIGCMLTSIALYGVAMSVTGVAVGGAIAWALVLLPATAGALVSALFVHAWNRKRR